MEEKGGGLQAEEHHPNCEARGGNIMLWECFAAGGTGALHKIDGITRKDYYVAISKQPNLLWEACGRLPKTFDPS